MKLRVRFAETDQMGVAHHSAYVVWLEAARVEWLRDRGILYREIESQGLSLAVAQLSIRYRAVARFDDELLIDTRLTDANRRRCCYEYRVLRMDDVVVVAAASTVHVPTGRSGRAVRLPEEWFEPLSKWTQEPF